MHHFNRDSLDYKFIDKLEAGLVLTGPDVKSLRTQPAQFQNSHVDILNGIPQIVNLNIPLYKFSHGQTIDTTSSRTLLLSQKQIAKLLSYRRQKYMLIPIAIYSKKNWFKVEIGIGRKMRQYEKRQKIKEREFKQQNP